MNYSSRRSWPKTKPVRLAVLAFTAVAAVPPSWRTTGETKAATGSTVITTLEPYWPTTAALLPSCFRTKSSSRSATSFTPPKAVEAHEPSLYLSEGVVGPHCLMKIAPATGLREARIAHHRRLTHR